MVTNQNAGTKIFSPLVFELFLALYEHGCRVANSGRPRVAL